MPLWAICELTTKGAEMPPAASRLTSVQTTNGMTHAIAVQPITWGSFDPHGCDWAMDMDHAFWLGKAWGETCMIWICPAKGEPIPWCQTDANSNAIGQRHPHPHLNTKDGITTPW